jgi:predicted PurR-regulated permease PerM
MSIDPQGSPFMQGPSDPFYRRVFAITAAVILGLAVYQIVQPFLRPFAWATILALLLHPLQLRLTRWLRGRDNLTALLLTLLTLFMFAGPLTALAIAFAAQARDLAELTTELVHRVRDHDGGSLASTPFLQPLFDWLNRYFSVNAAQVQQWAFGGVQRLLEQLASLGGAAFFGAVGTVLSFTVMIFLLFFLLRDGAVMLRTGVGLVPLSPEHKELLILRVTSVTRAVVLGTVLTAIVQGTLLGVGFAITGLPAPIVFGVLGAVLSVVPVGGTALVWVPASVGLFLTGDPAWGMFLATWGLLLVSTADNFLKPMLISGRAHVPTLAIFIGVIGGLSAFGLVGMFLGPIVIALVLTLVKFAFETRPDGPSAT